MIWWETWILHSIPLLNITWKYTFRIHVKTFHGMFIRSSREHFYVNFTFTAQCRENEISHVAIFKSLNLQPCTCMGVISKTMKHFQEGWWSAYKKENKSKTKPYSNYKDYSLTGKDYKTSCTERDVCVQHKDIILIHKSASVSA